MSEAKQMTVDAETLERCAVLLDATARFMYENPIAAEYTVDYDEAICDGSCLGDECRGLADLVISAIAQAEARS